MKLPHTPAAVVFDMDGLLFDTERLYWRAALSAARELGCPLDEDVFHQCIGTSLDENRRVLFAHYGPTYPFEELRVAWARYFRSIVAEELDLKAGALELLDLLDELRLPRAIATSSSHSTVRHHLERHGLVQRFHEVVAHGDYAVSKPAPDPFLKAAERLGIAPELCLALEDSHNGVRSAAAAGMMTIMVPDLVPASDEIKALCTMVVADLHGVRRVLAPGRG